MMIDGLTSLQQASDLVYKDGIPLHKGVILTTEKLDKNQALFNKWMNHWVSYPDLYLDAIKSKECPINLYPYQRLMLRVILRYRYVFITATRAFSKSFIAILALFLRCIFLPRSKAFLASKVKSTSVKVMRQKIDEILNWYPLLKNEIETYNAANDYIEIKFRNGSLFSVITMSSSGRGSRATVGILDEAATMSGDDLNEVVLPMLAVDRRTMNGGVNLTEPQQAACYITSAGDKSCFAYEKLIDILILSILRPNMAYVGGYSYKIPISYGQINQSFIEEQRLSPTFKETSFAREYGSVWTGATEEAWIDPDRLVRYRKLLNAKTSNTKSKNSKDSFFIISMDVGRTTAATAIVIIEVKMLENYYRKNVVNILTLTNMGIPDQVNYLKRVIQDYSPREVIIDCTGIGRGVVDGMVVPTFDPKNATLLPSFYVVNDEEKQYPPCPKGTEPIIYKYIGTPKLNSEMYSNFYLQFTSGHVGLLAPERIAKERLLATKKGMKMSLFDRARFLYPYEMTSRMIDEINNLRLKPTGATNLIEVERMSRRLEKDRFSALAMALWRIKYYEDKETRIKKKGVSKITDFLMGSSPMNRRR